jgi:hypothetical protein
MEQRKDLCYVYTGITRYCDISFSKDFHNIFSSNGNMLRVVRIIVQHRLVSYDSLLNIKEAENSRSNLCNGMS